MKHHYESKKITDIESTTFVEVNSCEDCPFLEYEDEDYPERCYHPRDDVTSYGGAEIGPYCKTVIVLFRPPKKV